VLLLLACGVRLQLVSKGPKPKTKTRSWRDADSVPGSPGSKPAPPPARSWPVGRKSELALHSSPHVNKIGNS